MMHRKLMIIFTLFNAVVNTIYLVRFFGILPPEEIVHGYISWFMSFMLPNTFIAITSWILLFSLLKKKDTLVIISGLLLSGALIFHALNGLMFGIYSGLWESINFSTLFEITVYMYGLSLATFYASGFWLEIRKLSDMDDADFS